MVHSQTRIHPEESKKRDKYLDLARKLRKLFNMKMMVIPIVISMLGMVPEELEISIVEIGQNTEKSPEDQRKFAITQDSIEKPSVIAHKEYYNNNNYYFNYNYFQTIIASSIFFILIICTFIFQVFLTNNKNRSCQ